MGSAKLHGGLSQILNYRLAAGVGLYLLSTCFFIVAIRNGELTVLYPLVSLGYVWTMLWSKVFFKEPLTRQKFLGLFLILVGVSFIGMGNR
jgi:drug/metabolite transporter (DMT)-like permease